MNQFRFKNLGFSLIELMVVVAIIAIIASVAIPSYSNYVTEGRRAECQSFAKDIAARQESFFNSTGNYSTTDVATLVTNLGLVDVDGNASSQSENGLCQVTAVGTNTGGAGFSITVSPQVADAECGNLTLDNIDRRSASGASTTEETQQCWGR